MHNSDHDKFSFLSNTTVAAIFPNDLFVHDDVVYAQTWEVLTLKNCIEPPQHASTAYVFALYGCLFFLTVLKKYMQLARIFWANGLLPLPPPPPSAKKN